MCQLIVSAKQKLNRNNDSSFYYFNKSCHFIIYKTVKSLLSANISPELGQGRVSVLNSVNLDHKVKFMTNNYLSLLR